MASEKNEAARELGTQHREYLERFFQSMPSLELEAEYLAALELQRLASQALVEVIRKAMAVMSTEETVH